MASLLLHRARQRQQELYSPDKLFAMGACLSSPSLTSRFGLDGVYVVDRLLARGGQGTVWLAHPADTADADKDVALKCTQRGSLSHQFAAQLAHEIQLTLFLGASHVHVARPRELLVTSSHLVLAMRFSPGGTLEALARNRSVGEAEAQYYVSQLVSALEYCHSVGVAWCASHRPNESDVAWAVLGNANSCARCTHRRDVKLANVLLDEHDPPWAQLCDWGVARRLSDDAAPKAFADAPPLRTTLVGTPGFLSPEVLDIAFNPQCVGYDAKAADVWSLGAAAHALVRRGAPPYAFDEAAARGGVKGAMRGVWAAARRGVAWDDAAPGARAGFSPHLAGFLGAAMAPRAVNRTSMRDLASHPWLLRPLPPHFAGARAKQAAAQACLAKCAEECSLRDTDAAIEGAVMRGAAAGGGAVGKKVGIERVGLRPAECERRAAAAAAKAAATGSCC